MTTEKRQNPLDLLNQGQREAVNLLNQWVDTREQFFVLEASAGYGKSFVVKTWLNSRPDLKRSVILCAPTHQALEQLVKDIPGTDAATIHSLLGYRPSATETEKQILVRAGNPNSPKIIGHRYVILDEAFYTPKILLNAITESYSSTRFIFLGDRKQLPPVGEPVSALIELLTHIKYKCSLTQNMRTNCELQKQLVVDVGEQGWNYDFSHLKTSRGKAIREMLRLIEDGDNDFLFIAYHHRVVNEWAKIIRELVYDLQPSDPYQAGEIVRLSGVIDSDKCEIIRNNEVVEIVRACPESKWIVVRRSTGEETFLDLDWEDEIGQAKIAALKSRDRKDWTKYHTLCRSYPTISSRWAITAHSSQGCTTGKAFIDLTDLKIEGSKELLLVAVSRSQRLISCI
jgi:exodeoxyribonuclease-5